MLNELEVMQSTPSDQTLLHIQLEEQDRLNFEGGAVTISKNELDQLRADKNSAYRQRNAVYAALAHVFPSGIRETQMDGWDPEWNGCCYVDLPSGQISFHYHSSEAYLFSALPPYTKPYDGHVTLTVEQRLAQVGFGTVTWL